MICCQSENTPTETDKYQVTSLRFLTDLRVALWMLLLYKIRPRLNFELTPISFLQIQIITFI